MNRMNETDLRRLEHGLLDAIDSGSAVEAADFATRALTCMIEQYRAALRDLENRPALAKAA